MELKWAHYAVGFQPNGWGVDVFAMLGGFGADPAQPLERPQFPLYLGVRIHAPFKTNPAGHALQATITDETGRPISNTQSVPVQFIVLPPGYPLLGLALVPLNGWKPLPGIGRYTVELAVDGTSIGQTPLVVNRKQGRQPQPGAPSTGGLRLGWAHYVINFIADPNLPGSLTIGGIFEYIRPEAPAGYNLKGSLLLLEILSDLTVNTQRSLTTELLDSAGQPAHDARGQLIMPPFTRPITLRRLSPAWDFLASTATVRFERDMWLAPGEYRFRFTVDGQPLGGPLNLTVVSVPSSPSVS